MRRPYNVRPDRRNIGRKIRKIPCGPRATGEGHDCRPPALPGDEGLRCRVAGEGAGALGSQAAWAPRSALQGRRRNKGGRERRRHSVCPLRRSVHAPPVIHYREPGMRHSRTCGNDVHSDPVRRRSVRRVRRDHRRNRQISGQSDSRHRMLRRRRNHLPALHRRGRSVPRLCNRLSAVCPPKGVHRTRVHGHAHLFERPQVHDRCNPPLPEQAAIVCFLDHADRRIRRYIRAKQKLIALLEEQKQAIIHQVVTGQIDVRAGEPYGEYKASGVEWLDKVPAQWEVKKLHQCGTIIGGMTPSMENRRFWDGSIPWVTPKDMKRDAIDDSGVKVTEGALHETSLRLIDPPAVLMVVRGMILARRVPIAWIKSPITINQDMKALLPGAGINAEFLARILDSAQEAFVPLIDQAGHGTCRLPTERWRSLAVAIPPADEQRLIVDSLEASTRTIVAAIENAHRQITLLDEYRCRLIADVVTGKLDVREAAAGLPEVDPLAAEGDSVDGVDHEAGSEHTGWRHAVEEGDPLTDVTDA